MKVLGFVPARGGSKGVPRKNVRVLHGKPLLVYTAEAARGARRLDHVVLSTDDQDIADVGQAAGLEVLFLRPPELSQDDTPTYPVVMHGLHAAEARYGSFDAVCLLQPTSPLRDSAEIDACIELLETSGADSVFSVLPVPSRFNPHWVYERDAEGFLHLSTGEATPIVRRQSLPPAFHRDGAIYVTRRDVLVNRGSMYGTRTVGFLRKPERSVDIDTLDDWARAEAMPEAFAASPLPIARPGAAVGALTSER